LNLRPLAPQTSALPLRYTPYLPFLLILHKVNSFNEINESGLKNNLALSHFEIQKKNTFLNKFSLIG
jgi:hypothetical protein